MCFIQLQTKLKESK